MSKYDDLVKKLREIFQIDKPDLDFGIYRIINQRADLINDYLETQLKAKVEEALNAGTQQGIEELEIELREARKNAEALGANPDRLPKVQELQSKYNSLSSGASEHQNAVFSHLLTFFSRYYESGDFISQRRYKGDTYAIPYSGEEVMLHWANKDQYYIKSGENFSNYTFRLSDERKVHFKLLSADIAKDNRKDSKKERCFKLIEKRTVTRRDEECDEYEETQLPVEEKDGELYLHFEYAPVPTGTKQAVLNTQAIQTIRAHDTVIEGWVELSQRQPTENNPSRTLLEKHLATYTAKNSADYFIHKNLKVFLRNELDFYIKNEVMHLDDLQAASRFADIEKNLQMIQCLRSIALELIDFLSQIENFQKKLWLKKKFVTETNYCITLDRIPEELYAAIAANEEQRKEWVKLYAIDEIKQDTTTPGYSEPLTVEFLKANDKLLLDSAFFETKFKAQLLASIHDLEEQCDGVLVHSENFQALKLLEGRYKEEIKTVYIDPPYNTSSSEIIYKNGYKHSSWLSMLYSGLMVSNNLLQQDNGVLCATIDDVEFKELGQQIEEIYGEIIGVVSIRIKPSGRPIPNGFALSHEYAVFAKKSEGYAIARLSHSAEQIARYRERDEKGPFFWEMFRKAGSNSNRFNRPTMFYPFYYDTNNYRLRLPSMRYNVSLEKYDILEDPKSNEIVICPIKDDGSEGCWYFGVERAKTIENEFEARQQDDGSYRIYYRRRPNEGVQPTTLWPDSKYSATEHGTALLKNVFGAQEVFSYPKSIHAVVDCLTAAGSKIDRNAKILDYFAGSGTTGHAVIDLNRDDNGNRKYILVEMGEYFDAVTKPRIQKVAYSTTWNNGKPTNRDTGISHCFKYLRLESYEDTLNNIDLKEQEADLFNERTKEDYLLRYFIDVEAKGSLLSVEDFKKPFDYKLKIATDSAGAAESKNIDLVETFNYLIGLRVEHIDSDLERGFVKVAGTLPTGEKTLVLWRDCDKIGYDALNKFCQQQDINPRDCEYDIVYVNGDHNIPSVTQELETEGGITRELKIRQIEPEFLQRMFEVEDV